MPGSLSKPSLFFSVSHILDFDDCKRFSLFFSLFDRGILEESAYMYQLLGLNLLSLLAQNRLAEFHTVSLRPYCCKHGSHYPWVRKSKPLDS